MVRMTIDISGIGVMGPQEGCDASSPLKCGWPLPPNGCRSWDTVTGSCGRGRGPLASGFHRREWHASKSRRFNTRPTEIVEEASGG